jgi:hypothetical protein
MSNGPVVENVLLSVESITVPGGKTGLAEPTGPVTSISALLDSGLQPADVRAEMICVSEPVGGVKIRVPSAPDAGAASAAPFRSNAPPAATATTRGTTTNRVKNLFLGMVELFLLQSRLFRRESGLPF